LDELAYREVFAQVFGGATGADQVFVIEVKRVNATTVETPTEPTSEVIGKMAPRLDFGGSAGGTRRADPHHRLEYYVPHDDNETTTTTWLSESVLAHRSRDDAAAVHAAALPWPSTRRHQQPGQRRQASGGNNNNGVALIELGGLESYTYVDSYVWLAVGAGTTTGDDPIQALIDAVFSGDVQRALAAKMGVASITIGFVTLPTYEPRLVMLDKIVAKGATPQARRLMCPLN
jgi:hypothetical protein